MTRLDRWRRRAAGLSAPYGWGVRAHGALYDRGWRRTHRAPCPVISVGNLVVGGTGKTPVTRALASALLARGRRPAIVLRGYGARGALERVPARWKGTDELLSRFGDEALAHARSLPEVAVVAHPDRVRAAAVAVASGADVVLLDDGFQHRRLVRDVDIVLLDWRRPLGPTGGLLPAGDLREPATALKRAHGVGWTRFAVDDPSIDDEQHARVHAARAELRVSPRLPDVRWRFRPGAVRRWGTDSPLSATRVVLVSGVARPDSVAETAAAAGLDVLDHLVFADHHVFTPDDLDAMHRARRSASADAIIMTEKDEVRLLAAGRERGIEKGTAGVLSLLCDALDPLDAVWRAAGV